MNKPQKTNKRYIPQIEPWFDGAELNEVSSVVKSTFITENAATERFLELIKGYSGADHAIAISNGTLALAACLMAEGIGPGDEVVVPDLTFIASANAVLLCGAKPIFCDVDEKTLGMTPELCEAKLSFRTRAIMPVHLYGSVCDMPGLIDLAHSKGMVVIEDAAEAFGVSADGKHAGTSGDYGVFSFFANKTLACGEGGVVLTSNEERLKKLYRVKNHGRDRKGVFIHEDVGFNFCFSDLHAAIGIAQFGKLERILERKRRVFAYYRENLAEVPGVEMLEPPQNVESNYWFCNILVDDPESLAAHLEQCHIGTRRFFYPLHLQPCYRNWCLDEEFPGASYLYEHGLSLPSSPLLTKEDLAYICETVQKTIIVES